MKKMLLWLPVFSGIPDVFLPDPAIDIFGNPLPVPDVDDSETKAVPDAVGKIRLDTDAAFLHTQLDVIENLPCEKYPGIEINYDKEIVKTDAGYISESLNAVKAHDFEGAALCWNIMKAPDEHINAAALS